MSTRFRVGDIVRCQRDTRPKGAWRNYADRVGTVIVADNYGEVGVAFARPGTAVEDRRAESWFLPSELVLVERPTGVCLSISGPPAGQMVLGCTPPEIGPQR